MKAGGPSASSLTTATILHTHQHEQHKDNKDNAKDKDNEYTAFPTNVKLLDRDGGDSDEEGSLAADNVGNDDNSKNKNKNRKKNRNKTRTRTRTTTTTAVLSTPMNSMLGCKCKITTRVDLYGEPAWIDVANPGDYDDKCMYHKLPYGWTPEDGVSGLTREHKGWEIFLQQPFVLTRKYDLESLIIMATLREHGPQLGRVLEGMIYSSINKLLLTFHTEEEDEKHMDDLLRNRESSSIPNC
eukprot:jgi/Psemu1/41817/gm1.41817_g